MRFFCFALFICLMFGCTNSKQKRSQLVDFVPEDTQLLVKCNSIEQLSALVSSNTFLNTISNSNALKHFKKTTAPLRKLNLNSNALLCFSKTKNDSITYTLISNYSKSLFLKDSLKNYSEELISYKNKTITISKINNATVYSTVVDSVFVLSSTRQHIDALFKSENKTNAFRSIYNVLEPDATTSLITTPKSTFLPKIFETFGVTVDSLGGYIALDAEITDDNLIVNGITKSADSIPMFLDIFKANLSQYNKLQSIAPSNCDGYLSISFDEFEVFASNLNAFRGHIIKDSTKITSALFKDVEEIGFIYQDEQPVIVLNSRDIIATNDALLDEKNKIDTYRGVSIFNFSKTELFSSTLAPFAKNTTPSKYCLIDHFFVFSNSIDALQNIIASYQNATVFENREDFKRMSKNFSSESSLIAVGTSKLLKTIAAKNIAITQTTDFKNYSLFGLQFIYDKNFSHVNGMLLKSQSTASRSKITKELFNTKLDAPVLNNPQFVTNHVTRGKDIVVQDTNHTLYLISGKGNILWKKELDGPVLGQIQQIDTYKNGRLQLVFNTSKSLYVLDRKGRDVAPFPLRFKTKITQPLAVFDYDKNKNYRLLVTQGKNVLMYDARGKVVKGFTFNHSKTPLVTTPKHFRIGTKDYIGLKTKRKLYILDRVGRTRVTPKTTHTFSKTPVFLYQNKFATTTKDGTFLTIDTKGYTETVDLKLGKNHHLVTTNKTRVTLNDNILSIKSRPINLDYGNYSKPNIFYIKNKIYVSVTDLDTSKVYLFDSQGNTIANFPVYGNSLASLSHTNNNLVLATKGEADTILCYQIN